MLKSLISLCLEVFQKLSLEVRLVGLHESAFAVAVLLVNSPSLDIMFWEIGPVCFSKRVYSLKQMLFNQTVDQKCIFLFYNFNEADWINDVIF